MIDCEKCSHYWLCDCDAHKSEYCCFYEEARPHGEWIPINIHEETWEYKCSVCGADVDIDFPNCPYCLADMQKKEGEAE